LPSVDGDGTTFYSVSQTANGTEYQQIDSSGQETGAGISKNNNGTVVISDGQGDVLTHNSDGTTLEQITVKSQDLDTGGETEKVIKINVDAKGNVTSWSDENGTYVGDASALANMLSTNGLAPVSNSLPDLSDPATVAQYFDNVSQQVTNQQNNQTQTDPGDGGDPGDSGGDGG
jgi:hypothetical protein